MKKHNMVSAYILEALILVPFVMLLLVTDDRRFAAFAGENIIILIRSSLLKSFLFLLPL